MLGFIENLAFSEIVILLVVAVLVFGGKLPEAAAQAAAQIQRLKRQLSDMRRDSGIDREIDAVKRSMDQIPRLPRTIDLVQRMQDVGMQDVERVARGTEPPAAPQALPPAQPTAASKTSAELGAAGTPSAGDAVTRPPTTPGPQDPPA